MVRQLRGKGSGWGDGWWRLLAGGLGPLARSCLPAMRCLPAQAPFHSRHTPMPPLPATAELAALKSGLSQEREERVAEDDEIVAAVNDYTRALQVRVDNSSGALSVLTQNLTGPVCEGGM